MDSLTLLFSLFLLSLFSGQGSAGHHHFRPTKLFVFGDSYVDTGNIIFTISSAQNFPYGITFPGKPTGRFSDGRVLTDFTAKRLGLKSPIPFITRQNFGLKRLKDGMNFAFGGTGVFNTLIPLPNMSTQIDFFQNLRVVSVFTRRDARFSLALVSVSGNDYSSYQTIHGSIEGMRPFMVSVVNQIVIDLKRISSLGVRRIVVTGLGPLGCLPQFTAASSFRQCNETINSLVEFHNFLLKQAVSKLNNETKESSFFILDVYGTFLPILQGKINSRGDRRFETPLKPCCLGVSSGFSCGSVDLQGNKKYVLCEDPKSAFFWDNVHPTQEGWATAFSSFKSSL